MREFRIVCLNLSLLVGTCGFVSCDKDSDESITKDNVVVSFKLFDMTGKESTTFSYGDNITFKMSISNNGSHPISIDKKIVWNYSDFFQVYTKNGKAVEKPWDEYSVYSSDSLQPYSFLPEETLSWSCKWKGDLVEVESFDDIKLIDSYTNNAYPKDAFTSNNRMYKFIQTVERDFLPVGEYYCQFEITLGENDKRTCHVDFRIVENPDVQQGDTINPILKGKVYDSIKEFYDNYYGLDTDFRSFFDNSNKSQCLVINSTEELKTHYLGDYPFPELDFERYTLIVGQKMMPESYYTVLRQELISFGDELRLNVYVPKLDGAYTAFQNLFYWGLYPKVQSSNITVKIFK